MVSEASRMFRAISFGVFCRDAPSTSAIIRSTKLSPGFWVMRTTIRSLNTVVPPVTAVLAAGALAESKILGGQAVIAIADDIETAFTFGQNWPLGSALSMVLIVIIGTLALFGVSKVDLDAIMGRKR